MIQQKFLFAFAVILLLVSGWFFVDRVTFIRSAQKATGEVTQIDANQTRCSRSSGTGKRRRTSHYDCTNFSARVTYTTSSGDVRTFNVGAGSVIGHTDDIARANRRMGARVPVIYNPKDPDEAYQDTLLAVWGLPGLSGGGGGLMVLASLTGRRRRTWAEG